ncbi:MAG: hypothetical protein OHK0046_12100 [Anaerolineae bacterium]
MAIDHIIDYDCIPKQTLTTEGILERLKGRNRAAEIIKLFRRNGDERPPSEMGFEFTRSTPEGYEETRVIVVQDLLDAAADLDPLEHHCAGCPANRLGRPFGCMDFVNYPITQKAEAWMLNQMPVPDEPLIWLLLRQGIKEFKYDGTTVLPLREGTDAYFEAAQAATRRLGEFVIDANQVFEMVFGVGAITPNHAALVLLFFHAIRRDLEADEIMWITPAPDDAESKFPFRLDYAPDDDEVLLQIKDLLKSLYIAWKLNVRLLLDV